MAFGTFGLIYLFSNFGSPLHYLDTGFPELICKKTVLVCIVSCDVGPLAVDDNSYVLQELMDVLGNRYINCGVNKLGVLPSFLELHISFLIPSYVLDAMGTASMGPQQLCILEDIPQELPRAPQV